MQINLLKFLKVTRVRALFASVGRQFYTLPYDTKNVFIYSRKVVLVS